MITTKKTILGSEVISAEKYTMGRNEKKKKTKETRNIKGKKRKYESRKIENIK